MNTVALLDFFYIWKTVCQERTTNFIEAWENRPDYTNVIFGDYTTSVIAEVGRRLKLNTYFGYYHLDAILFKEADLVVDRARKNETWVQDIRVAFEHENDFKSGLFQETSHLLTTRAESRVLVTYPERHDTTDELDKLARTIAGSDIATAPAFLLIFGKRTKEGKNVAWEGRTFLNGGWETVP